MAESFAQGFFRGFAEQSTKQNDTQFDSNVELDRQYKLNAQRLNLEHVHKMSEQYAKEQQLNRDKIQQDAEKRAADETRKKALFGETADATQVFSPAANPNNQPYGVMPDQDNTSNTGQTAAPVSPAGSITATNIQPPANTPAVQNAPQQPNSMDLSPEQLTQATIAQSASKPIGEQPVNPDAQTSTNTVSDQPLPSSSSQPATSINDKVLASKGISLPDDELQRLSQAHDEFEALSPKLRDAYVATLGKDDKANDSSKSIMNNDPSVQAWRLGHGMLTDGTVIPPLDLVRQKTDPYGLYNPHQSIQMLATDKADIAKINDERRKELSMDIKSPYSINVLQPLEKSSGLLNGLMIQGRTNDIINSGVASGPQSFWSKLLTTIGVEGDTAKVASMNDAFGAIVAQEKREAIRNPGQRTTGMEFSQITPMYPNADQTPQGRATIINYLGAIHAQNMEAATGLEMYKQVNNTLRGGDDIVRQYNDANPILNTRSFDPAVPGSIINSNVRSFSNWQLIQSHNAVGDDKGNTFNIKTGQPLPDTLKDKLNTLIKSTGQPGNSSQASPTAVKINDIRSQAGF